MLLYLVMKNKMPYKTQDELHVAIRHILIVNVNQLNSWRGDHDQTLTSDFDVRFAYQILILKF